MVPLPALFPPADGGHHTWPAPNYVDPETRGWGAPAGIIFMCVVTSCVVVARLWARFGIKRTAGWDDWLIIASMPGLLGLTISTVLALRVYGFQLHIWDQTPRTHITVRQITMAMEVIYIGTTTLTKLSILMFYRRITSSVLSRPLLICIWASIVFVALYGPATILALIFTCDPVEAYWYRFTTSWLRTHEYKCVDEVIYLVAVISISTAQDFLACMLPMFVVYKLRLPLRQKIGLACVFLLGLAVCATGALRIHYAHRLLYYTRLNPSPTYDITWEALGSWVATAVETNVSIICASAPALNAYFKGWFGLTGYQERSFGWYGKTARTWSGPCEGSDKTLADGEKVEMPCRSYGSASVSGCSEMLQRNDSIVPILKAR
ncbi:hypothetical protein HBI56_157520 [Parastagonospora nodorum]|uniref:Rhodopsin domain-containing protein n=2 Tax=Phaeosphaeria nodorum (strain SN15 / ATCC MYA-4574 / FGSC 10173) TaxID=321614 RepID=A0A7U2ET75_PHANO|nr:hypothetical protein HBH56_188260 [Parastagonospora nodorum]QRC92227.1 hypothetical protein JI435_023690 [Parastagonospora nodorum SN15]KAH3925106.1 hypothetical protein HBH54_184070 [Parastagonospora nodorum]KAH3954515.1 hypothetical protein HBH53_023420 [Parastagonospora nodorum]KAH3963723.1 hypothetical protein HBH51_163250 [Parastagonospora nodorum]